ncbi:hypothetical protein [Alicyclobacillus sp. SO9]|uniref:hypothetical protein n=1 Tax=Alicyclobacillus sp. SO9 TaxID=2665646 RepID=UPI0018E9053C|nr:hypothetical protein [Alicyclobacillus sp. SO9]QQE77501.1 hypothetical protein GI364_16335 [Alicyclobacillus sp. SO9]
MRKTAFMLWGLLLVAAIAVVWLGNQFGQWYFTFVVGLVIGLWGRPGFSTWLGSWAVGVIGWGLPLALRAVHEPVIKTADVVAGIAGLGNSGMVVLGVTILLGFLLATVGVWLGAALRSWRPAAR